MSLSPDRSQVTLDISDDVENTHSTDDSNRIRDWTGHTTSRLMPEHPRHGLSNGLNSFIREITPFLGQVSNANTQPQNTSWINRITSNIQETVPNQNGQGPHIHNYSSGSHRTHINLSPLAETHSQNRDPLLANRSHEILYDDRDPAPLVNVNTENNEAEALEPSQRINRQADDDEENEPTAQSSASDLLVLLRGAFKYAPVFLILLAKFVYDYSLGLISLSAMIVTFFHTNQFVKEEAAKHTNRDIHRSFWAVVYTLSCVLLVEYLNGYSQKNWGYLILMPDFNKPADLWEMLWIICITDFILKFITIDLKLFFSCLPERLLPYKKKGKFYFFIEALSQLYRSVVPVQPWLFYLLESYQGYEKLLSVALSTAYIVSKGFEVLKKAKLLKTASSQLIKSSNLGITPNEEQMDSAGKMCPICHEEYHTPVLLSCSHIFCETCLVMWFNKVQTCPLCRAQVIGDSSWRDGGTSQYCQLY